MPRKAISKPAPPPIEPLALEEVALADLKPHPQTPWPSHRLIAAPQKNRKPQRTFFL
jgi:hypothetical protein